MALSWILSICILPSIVVGLITNYEAISIDKPTFIYQAYYMYDPASAPRHSGPESGMSYIDFVFKLSKMDHTKEGVARVEVGIVTGREFDKMGYQESEETYYCCDGSAVENKLCNREGTIAVREQVGNHGISFKQYAFDGKDQSINVRYNVTTTGKYYLVMGMCSQYTSNVKLSGTLTTMNPYGHIPAQLYGILPFSTVMLIVYSVIFVIWWIRCFAYKNELMSVHYITSLVISLFVFEALIKYLSVKSYNEYGVSTHFITIFSLLIGAATRTLSRMLMIVVAMGLGVSKPSLSDSLYKIIGLGITYFCVTLWDSFSFTYSLNSKADMWCVIVSSFLDAVIYFWILQSLLDTIQELEDKKQTSKLKIFIQLRNIIIFAVIISTLYNVGFSYLMMSKTLTEYWQYEWLFNDGIWSLFYLGIVVVVMWLWRPNEHSYAYAYHVQVASDDHQDAEEYRMEDSSLVPEASSEQNVKVATVQDEMKPMKINANSS